MMSITRNPGKKGMFYSLSVIVFLLFLIVVFINKSEIQKKEEQFHIERAQIIVMDHYVKDFDNYYVEVIIYNAARPAIIALAQSPSAPFTNNELIGLMNDGTEGVISMNSLFSTDNNFAQALGTLTFMLDSSSFSYTVSGVEQLDYETIRIDFLVDYSFEAFSNRWHKQNKPVSIIMPVIGLWHPVHNDIIDDSWVEDSSAADCYINKIMSSAPACTGVNIRPPSMCGNGLVEAGETCDDGNVVSGDGCDANCQTEIIP